MLADGVGTRWVEGVAVLWAELGVDAARPTADVGPTVRISSTGESRTVWATGTLDTGAPSTNRSRYRTSLSPVTPARRMRTSPGARVPEVSVSIE